MTSWINDIIDDVWINVLTNLTPKEFASIRQTCKHFDTLSKGGNNARVKDYWKQRCCGLCDQVVEEYKANSWEAIYKELDLLSSETAKEIFPNVSTYDDDWSTKRLVYKKLTPDTERDFELIEALRILKRPEKETETENKQELKIDEVVEQLEHKNIIDDVADDDNDGRFGRDILRVGFGFGNRKFNGSGHNLPVPPLLVQCIKFDCANVLEMLFHDDDHDYDRKTEENNGNHVNKIINCVTSKWVSVPWAREPLIKKRKTKYRNVTPLCIACEYNSIKVVQLLLTYDFIDFTIKGRIGMSDADKPRTALVNAILKKHSKIAMMLIDNKNIPIKVLNDPEVFYFACVLRFVNVVQLLLNKNVNSNAIMYNSFTLNEMISRLGEAQKDNSVTFSYNNKKVNTIDEIKKVINLIVNNKNTKLNQSDLRVKSTPLITAIESLDESQENMDIIDSLIKNGADVNQCAQSQPNHSPLHIAILRDKPKFVEFLLQNKANVAIDFGDESQSITPLMIACSEKKESLDIVKILLKYKINVFGTNSFGSNVIHMAALNNHFQSIEIIYNHLVQNKVDEKKIKHLFNQQTKNEHKTPYMIALEMKHMEVIKVLVNVCKVDEINVPINSNN